MNIYRIIGGEKMEENLEEKKIFNIQIGIAIGGIILGTLLHFLYHWTGENGFIATFSATNESVWEHLKLVFFPMLVLGIVEYFFVKDKVNNYIEAKVIGIFVAISFVVVVFYTYTGMLGTNFFQRQTPPSSAQRSFPARFFDFRKKKRPAAICVYFSR